MKSWLEKKAVEMYSTHNEKKSLVAERFKAFFADSFLFSICLN